MGFPVLELTQHEVNILIRRVENVLPFINAIYIKDTSCKYAKRELSLYKRMLNKLKSNIDDIRFTENELIKLYESNLRNYEMLNAILKNIVERFEQDERISNIKRDISECSILEVKFRNQLVGRFDFNMKFFEG